MIPKHINVIKILLSLITLLTTNIVYGTPFPDDTVFSPQKTVLKTYNKGATRSFSSVKKLDVAEIDYQTVDDLILAAGYFPDSSISEEEQYIHDKAQEVEDKKKFIDYLSFDVAHELPVGIKKDIGGTTYTILIDSLIFTQEGVEVVAYMSLKLPNNGRKIAFKGRDIRFTASGGFQGSARLELVTEIPIKLSGETVLILKGGYGANEGEGTYASFDCYGFKELGIKAELLFSKNLIVPDTPSGEPDTANVVRASFQTIVSSWNDIVVEINIPPFQIKNLDDFSFFIDRAVIDFSDLRNVPNFTLPEGYNSDWLPEANSPLWQGVYIRTFIVKIPPYLNKDKGNTRSEIGAYDVVIDQTGFSGTIAANRLISTGDGNAGGWGFSVDSLAISLQASQFSYGYFDGGIQTSIAPQEFDYVCIIDPSQDLFNFRIKYTDNIDFEAFIAKGSIDSTSYLDVTVKDNQFLPRAVLNGSLSVGGDKVTVADIRFEELTLQTVSPYVSVKNVSFGSGLQNFSNFPIVINELGMEEEGDKVGLKMNVMINLSQGKIAGNAGLIIWGVHVEEGEVKQMKPEGIQVTKIGIDIDASSFKLKGVIDFFENDETYGEGFKGSLDLTLLKGAVGIRAEALFGNTPEFRYWYVDAMFNSNSGIPILSEALKIYGLGGGLYRHMRQVPMNEAPGFDPKWKTAAGLVYKPDESIKLGLRASVHLGALNKDAVNVETTFEIAFNQHGGISFLGFQGVLRIASPAMFGADKLLALTEKLEGNAQGIAETIGNSKFGQGVNKINNKINKNDSNNDSNQSNQAELPSDAAIVGRVIIQLDLDNKVFHANMDLKINGGALTGGGQSVMHYEPKSWYIHIGTPDDRIFLDVLGLARIDAYFMLGDKIPEIPPPPQEVIDILKLGDEYNQERDEGVLAKGRGIAFGASFRVSVEQSFLIFYCQLKAGLGFDVMVKKYPEGVRCRGRSGPIGIDGWYAKGQAYAYFQGAIGIRTKVFRKRIDMKILEIGAAVLLQAELPNPVWMRGIVGGYFSILGGLVKGQCRFEATIGERCEMVGGSIVSTIEMIQDITPGENENDVDVFNSPQVVFSMPVNKAFEMVDVDDIKKTYRAKLEKFDVLYNGQPIRGDLKWNPEQDVVIFKSFEILPPETTLSLIASVRFEEKVNGVWQVIREGGQPILETKGFNFTTGEAPDYIPFNNIAYSYPIPQQLHFHRSEITEAYIKLDRGQSYLFTELEEEWDRQEAHWIKNEQNPIVSRFSYDYEGRQVNISIPPNLENASVYHIDMVNIPKQKGGNIDQNVISKEERFENVKDVSISSRKAKGNITNYEIKSILGPDGFHFRTSQFETFEKKFRNLSISSGWSWPVAPGVDVLGTNVQGDELFDKFELEGDNKNQVLIQMEATLNNNWYQNKIKALIYDGLSYEDFNLYNRETDSLGVPPVKAVNARQYPSNIELSTENFKPSGIMPKAGAFIYNLPWVMGYDFVELRNQAYNHPNKSIPWVAYITNPNNFFPSIEPGKYEVIIRYVLPGGRITFEDSFKIRNK